MDALEFAKQKRRMCKSYGSQCDGCALKGKICWVGSPASDEETDKKNIEAVEKWVKEHPEKTREDEFLAMFPNAHMKNGHIDICPQAVDTSLKCPPCDRLRNVQEQCKICIEEFWLKSVED